MKAGLVLTSIYDPVCLDGYYENFKKYGRLDDVEVFMVADTKTPREAALRCQRLNQAGMRTHFVGIGEAAEFISKLGLIQDMFPQNTDHRRNIGYLMALDRGVDFVISIDDDNFARPGVDCFLQHSRCCGTFTSDEITLISSSEHWYNPCALLKTNQRVFQRGFPYFGRKEKSIDSVCSDSKAGPVHVNEGLWCGDPDLDAMTWLVTPAKATWLLEEIVLAEDTWAPVNSQNTAVRSEAMSAYYFIPMHGGPSMEHMGDIFQGYFLEKCMKHLGGYLKIGQPVVDHRRNSHNYMNDVQKELPSIRLLEEMLPWLVEGCKLEGKDYCEAYLSLADQLAEWVEGAGHRGIVVKMREYIQNVTRDMRLWARTCQKIGVAKAAA